MNEIARPRANRDGRPCPPWCATDHSGPDAVVCIGGRGGIDRIWTRAIRTPSGSAGVNVSGSLPDADADWPHLNLDARDAEHLAVIVGLLADATPEQHRELAAAIRANAALIAQPGDGPVPDEEEDDG